MTASIGVDVQYLHTDHLGSPVAATDNGGTVVDTHGYYPFGEIRSSSTAFDTERGFTGQITDAATGLNFYNARYMDPALGRFISPDSIVPNPFNSGIYNRYGYVSNNPLRYTDPTGFSCEGDSVDDPRACDSIGGSNTTSNPFADPTVTNEYYWGSGPNMWSVIWEDTKDTVHLGLDVVGTVPVFGEPADLLNAGIYALEGDELNAALSAAGAIPFWGWFATGAKLAGKYAPDVAEATKWARPETLDDHFLDHGGGLDVANAFDYAQQASDFLVNSTTNPNAEIVVNRSTGVVSVFDTATKTFGAYNADGTTRTFFAANDNYWSNVKSRVGQIDAYWFSAS